MASSLILDYWSIWCLWWVSSLHFHPAENEGKIFPMWCDSLEMEDASARKVGFGTNNWSIKSGEVVTMQKPRKQKTLYSIWTCTIGIASSSRCGSHQYLLETNPKQSFIFYNVRYNTPTNAPTWNVYHIFELAGIFHGRCIKHRLCTLPVHTYLFLKALVPTIFSPVQFMYLGLGVWWKSPCQAWDIHILLITYPLSY